MSLHSRTNAVGPVIGLVGHSRGSSLCCCGPRPNPAVEWTRRYPSAIPFLFSQGWRQRICFGIYSSVLVMAPLVMWMGVSREDLVKPERRKNGPEGEKILPGFTDALNSKHR